MLLITYGTRPEWIKVSPLIEELKKQNADFRVLFTGQHDNFFNATYDYKFDVKKDNISRLNSIFSQIMSSEQLDDLQGFEWVLVQGDTASVCAIALTYYNLGKKIIHLEAGLRTYDLENPKPEEAYRQMVSRISSLNLCPMQENVQNLKQEKCSGESFIVGNTVLDNLKDISTSYQNKVLVTLHRRENIGIVSQWFKQFDRLAELYPDIEFTLPLHPNKAIRKYSHLLKNVNVIEPLQHDELVDYMKDCKLIITDSGGIQEEATFMEKKVIVCRKETERDNSIGNIILCKTPQDLTQMFSDLVNDYKIEIPICPYGDGKSAEKIVKIFKNKGII